ncbi:TBC1 domain family member 5 homolog B isoform X2 [Brachypodium distachyon]|uniref:TBC1 domain family member 5 homolog B isoform X2 n=1 Tax=Brachypodium distachyon TaxID=15368 RepID=UPI0006E4A829|nr:TBC1 domain family member 5 homolog B isoform X2 [Brachypodium distachyon]|eukprot:XP_024311816.1 TBC1 domain family member 5 homolog B isoform X2 [Brachypodium distachyon]
MPEPPARPRFSGLRGARWRADLGVIPSSPAVPTNQLRRAAADSRRRYANLRRRLLIDPHHSKDEEGAPDLVVENPLSQNPESTWGQYFKNAELEKMLNQDLSRLYPELGDFFQTITCQAMLERILLVWSLRYPEFGYKQGMHELLAPLLYVLHVDVQHFKEVRVLHEELFDDDFDGQTFPDRLKLHRSDRTNTFEGSAAKIRSLDDLDPDTRDLLLINDEYGAEGELGIILSEKFMEHDAYCMFENLMNGLVNGAQGVVAITDFYSLSPAPESSTGLTPVREASSAIYHLLASVDSSLHSHLVELGVEPQYFALRWLRVLFGREFSLDNLLFIWDEIFSSPNHPYCTDIKSPAEYQFKVLCSPRGALILSMAVSMMLHLRSSLLGSEHATSCLVRLLNFPEDIDLTNLIEKAKLLQPFALESNLPSSPLKGKNPLTPPNYWEETWKMLQMSGDKSSGGPVIRLKGRGLLRRSVSNTESDISTTKDANLENSLTSTSQSIVDELHDTDTVPAKVVNSLPPMPIEHRNDRVGQGIAEISRSNSNGVWEAGHGYYPTSSEIRDPLGATSGYLSRDSSTSLSCGTDYDHDTNHAEEPCFSHDEKVVNEPDPPSVHKGRIDESRPRNGKIDEAAITNQTVGSVDYQQHTLCFDVGSSSSVADKELTGKLRSLGESMIENIQE